MSSPAYDEEQNKLMEEMCILVDEQDRVLGPATKRECHLNENIKKGMLHRAFSVFLFNSKNQLLLQQRSHKKITFPLCWTNTCCSHPLHFAAELEEKGSLGVKRAAQRKLEHELGIKPEDISLDEFHFLTRIHYLALSDGLWGEHEVDHILFVRKDVDYTMNLSEVDDCKYVTPEELRDLLDNHKAQGLVISPWFHMIAERFLFPWWKRLDDVFAGTIPSAEVAQAVHKLELKD